MSMDPSKWIGFDQLTDKAKKKLSDHYPYMNFDNCQFQEKFSGVFYRQINSVKIEKLLDEERANRPAPPAKPARQSSSGGRKRG